MVETGPTSNKPNTKPGPHTNKKAKPGAGRIKKDIRNIKRLLGKVEVITCSFVNSDKCSFTAF